jgi:hypothetical protein
LLLNLLFTESFTKFLQEAVLIAVVFFIGLNLYSSSIDASKILPIPYKQTGYPYTHWIMMGLKGPYGFYDYYDVMYTESFPTKDTRTEANIRMIKARIHNYGFMGLAKLFSTKNLFVWGDGTYFAPIKLNRGVPKYTPFHHYILPLNTHTNYVYIYLCQIVQGMGGQVEVLN